VRPYFDVAGTVLSVEQGEPGTVETTESVTGFGATGAVGLRVPLAPKVAVDGSLRLTVSTLSDAGASGPLGDARSGRSIRAVLGVSWTPGAR